MTFGVNEAIGLVGAGANLLGGTSAARAQKEYLRRQRDIANEQLGMFREARPQYSNLLREYEMRAGLGPSAGVTRLGPGRFGVGSNYGDQEMQLRLQQAEDDIDRRARQNANQLRFQLGQRGIATGTQAAALARNQALANSEFSGFRRQLAIDAERERERRLAQLAGLLGIGFGQGGVAQSVLGQQAGQFGQEAASQFSNLGNIAQQYMYQQQLERLGGRAGTPYPYSADTYSSAIPGLPGSGEEDLPWWLRSGDPRKSAFLRNG